MVQVKRSALEDLVKRNLNERHIFVDEAVATVSLAAYLDGLNKGDVRTCLWIAFQPNSANKDLLSGARSLRRVLRNTKNIVNYLSPANQHDSGGQISERVRTTFTDGASRLRAIAESALVAEVRVLTALWVVTDDVPGMVDYLSKDERIRVAYRGGVHAITSGIFNDESQANAKCIYVTNPETIEGYECDALIVDGNDLAALHRARTNLTHARGLQDVSDDTRIKEEKLFEPQETYLCPQDPDRQTAKLTEAQLDRVLAHWSTMTKEYKEMFLKGKRDDAWDKMVNEICPVLVKTSIPEKFGWILDGFDQVKQVRVPNAFYRRRRHRSISDFFFFFFFFFRSLFLFGQLRIS